jgi:nascent polypeptide-associated complex subunit alpha
VAGYNVQRSAHRKNPHGPRTKPNVVTLNLAPTVAPGMFGGGGMNPRKMEQMMKQMGIDMDEIDAESVIIVTEDEELVFDSPQVTKMDAQGQETYQIVGSPDVHQAAGGDDAGAEAGEADATDADADDADDGDTAIPDEDVELVAERAGVPPSKAREALADNDGDLAAAISALE